MEPEQEDTDGVYTEDFSTERFIDEVRIQPAIWDITSPEYSSRVEKLKAWEQICCNVIPNFVNLDAKEKNKKAIQLQKRWKGLRRCFNREKSKKRLKIQKTSTTHSCRKQYRYYNQLSFLASLGDIRPGRANPPDNVHPPIRHSIFDFSKSQETEQTHGNHRLKKSSNHFEKKREESDHDLDFLHSLLPHIKKVSDEFKLDLQSEILDTLKKYVNYSRSNMNFNQYPQQYVYVSNSPTTSTLDRNTAASPVDSSASQDSEVKENMFTDE